MLICRSVRLACYEKPKKLPVGLRIDRIGTTWETCRIVYARPRPCIISKSTNISISTRCDITKEELKENIVLKLDYKNFVDYLIYPKKTWEKIESRYIRPLLHDQPPKEPGALLYGPPGVGKTSVIETIANYLGLHLVSIISSSVLSPYIGESEKMLKQKLEEAERNEPSIVKLDDAEWLLMKRKSLAGRGGAEAIVSSSMLQLLLDRLPRWKINKRRILAIVTTNVSPEVLDPALIRSGRLGRKPIFVPLPNYEAIYTLMIKYGVDKKIGAEKTEEYAKKLTNLGINMADVKDVIMDLLEGKEPDLEETTGGGYIKPVPWHIYTGWDYNKLKEYILPESLKSPKTRLYVALPTPLAEALVVQYLVYLGKSVVLLVDDRQFDEAIYTAETSNAVLVVDTETIHEDVQKIIYRRAKVPVIFIGETHPPFTVKITLNTDILYNVFPRKHIVRIFLDYYGIKYKEKDLEEFIESAYDKVYDILPELKYWAINLDLERIIDYINVRL